MRRKGGSVFRLVSLPHPLTPLPKPSTHHVQEEAHLKVMRMIDANPEISQREIAAELGISLGKTNYCLRALTEKGFVKARNFRRSTNKMRYIYQLTPKGLEHKARLTLAFLERKRREYEALRREIELLQHEVGSSND